MKENGRNALILIIAFCSRRVCEIGQDYLFLRVHSMHFLERCKPGQEFLLRKINFLLYGKRFVGYQNVL